MSKRWKHWCSNGCGKTSVYSAKHYQIYKKAIYVCEVCKQLHTAKQNKKPNKDLLKFNVF